MKKQDTPTEKLIKKMVTKLADPTPWEWPPQCIGFMYQPVRPKRSMAASKQNTKNPTT